MSTCWMPYWVICVVNSCRFLLEYSIRGCCHPGLFLSIFLGGEWFKKVGFVVVMMIIIIITLIIIKLILLLLLLFLLL